MGDSDALELGDTLSIFGYPGIGGETVTFTAGSVAGFTAQQGLRDRRAWIKTDATIAGGNSGGTAVNEDGELVGVPTQAAAGSDITPVDARPVVDTNRDGRVDERDSPMAIGGFINGLRPVNLAKPLLQQAGVQMGGQSGAGVPMPMPLQPAPSAPADGPSFGNLVFSSQVTQDGRPINPAALLPAGGNQMFASFEFQGMQNGLPWSVVWALNGQTIVSTQHEWSDGVQGRKTLVLSNQQGLPEGTFHLVVAVGNQVMTQGEVVIGRREEDSDTQLSGTIADGRTGPGIAGALVIALRPGVSIQDFLQRQDRGMAFTSARTEADGSFTFPQQLPKGQAYGLVVVARGYQDLAVESALRLSANAPEQAQLNPIQLEAE